MERKVAVRTKNYSGPQAQLSGAFELDQDLLEMSSWGGPYHVRFQGRLIAS